MSRRVRVPFLFCASLALAALAAACGTEHINVPRANVAAYRGAVLFSQRCSGCHTLGYAGTHGSAPNIRIAQGNSGPNFNVRCERPITRVLYAIENGGFSGAYMPQNIVVGQDAVNVAKFVSAYAGSLAPKLTGITRCQQQPVGTLPGDAGSPTATTAQTSSTSVSPAAAAFLGSGQGTAKSKAKHKRKHP